jgi:hypothetical protein
MPVIKPRTRGKRLVNHRMRLHHENNETFYAFAQFLGESTEYVLHELVDTVLAKDKDVRRWRADHPQSCIPRLMVRRPSDARAEPTTARPFESTGALSGLVTRERIAEREVEDITLLDGRPLVALSVVACVGMRALSVSDRPAGANGVARFARQLVP